MKASKKDYEAIAAILREQVTLPGRTAQQASWFKSVAVDIAGVMRDSNPAFSRERFLTACGV